MRADNGSDDDMNSYERANTNDVEDKGTSQLLGQSASDPLTGPEKKCVQPGGLKVIVISSIIFALAVTVALVIDIYTGEHNVGHGAVASDVKRCSIIGEDVLKKGGSAVDAAIATVLCVGVVSLQSSGIGGGGFMLVQTPEGDVEVIDFREVAPSAASKDMFSKKNKSSINGGLSVAVPGEVRGLELAHQKFGKLKWSELFQPAIKVARDGFPLLNSTKEWMNKEDIAKQLPKNLKELLNKNHTNVKRPLLAKTLEVISNKGSQGFYFGEIADSIVKTVTENDGILTLGDLKNYTAKIRKPLVSDYKNFRVFTSGPPSSGLVLLSALNILEGFNLTKHNKSDLLVYHYLVETLKFVYAQRSRLADPDFVNLKNITEAMLSKQQAGMLRRRINETKTFTNASYYGPFFDSPPNKGTSHVIVMDRKGGIVSVTSTINSPFGSKLYTPTGIILNNEMDDFSSPGKKNYYDLEPSEANFIAPGKRPLSSISPVIALEKSDLCGHQVVLGASGGTRITSAVIQVLFNILAFNRNISDAIERPRLHHQLLPMILEVEEDRFKEKGLENVMEFLEKKGNKLETKPKITAFVNGALKRKGHLRGHADGRRVDSFAAVY